MWLLCIGCAWVAGTLLGSWFSPSMPVLAVAIAPLVLAPLLPRQRTALLLCALIISALLCGALRFRATLPDIDPGCLAYYNGEDGIALLGVVGEEPEYRGTFAQFTLSARELLREDRTRSVSGNALVRVPRYPRYEYGDLVRLTGKATTPPVFPEFDYRAYLARSGIHTIIYYPDLERIDRGHGSELLKLLYGLRDRLSTSLARAIPEPEASLAQAILLGTRSAIPDPVTQTFSRTGTAHLLAISGLHIGMVIAAVLAAAVALLGRQRGTYAWLALCAIWVYALLTGMRPPVARGAIMGSMVLFALLAGRQRSSMTALVFAAAVMVGINPHLLWNPSYQLSFAAMAGLVLLFPHLRQARGVVLSGLGDDHPLSSPTLSMLWDGIMVTLAATIAVWPLVAYHFGILSFVGVPATMFSLPALPLIIGSGGLVAVAGVVSPMLAQGLGWLTWAFTNYLLSLVEVFDQLPGSSLQGLSLETWHVATYYGALAVALILLDHRTLLRSVHPTARTVQRI